MRRLLFLALLLPVGCDGKPDARPFAGTWRVDRGTIVDRHPLQIEATAAADGVFALRPDGSATVSRAGVESSATWTLEEGGWVVVRSADSRIVLRASSPRDLAVPLSAGTRLIRDPR